MQSHKQGPPQNLLFSVVYKMNLKLKTKLVKNKSQEQVEAAAITKKRYRV